MRFWICGSEIRSGWRWIGLAGLFVTGSSGWPVPAGPPRACAATLSHEFGIQASGGYESDLVVDPDLDFEAIEGGPFAQLAPWIELGPEELGRLTWRLGTRASWQSFVNATRRRLFGQVAWLEVQRTFAGNALRLSGDFSLFDDSERPEVRRRGYALELGWARGGARWRAELFGGIDGRRYPDLISPDEMGVLGIYQEISWNVGLATTHRLGREWIVSVDFSHRGTDARDPLYDAGSWIASLRSELPLGRRWALQISGWGQWRRFDHRNVDEEDRYLQAGAGFVWRPSPRMEWLARYGFAHFDRSSLPPDDSHRVEIGVRVRFGSRSAPDGMPVWNASALTRLELPELPSSERPVRFALQAPDAQEVLVVGDFNDWGHPPLVLEPAEGGGWVGEIELSPGTYQYLYVVDGEWTTPPDAQLTIDDGFGGRNGLLQVLPPGP